MNCDASHGCRCDGWRSSVAVELRRRILDGAACFVAFGSRFESEIKGSVRPRCRVSKYSEWCVALGDVVVSSRRSMALPMQYKFPGLWRSVVLKVEEAD